MLCHLDCPAFTDLVSESFQTTSECCWAHKQFWVSCISAFGLIADFSPQFLQKSVVHIQNDRGLEIDIDNIFSLALCEFVIL